MFTYLYEWLMDLSFYLIMVTAVTYILPSAGYRKYIRFFTGLVLILMLLSPVFELIGAENKVQNLLKEYDFEQEILVNENEKSYEGKISDIQIEVEEINVGYERIHP